MGTPLIRGREKTRKDDAQGRLSGLGHPPPIPGEREGLRGKHLEAPERVPLPPAQAGPGAGGAERGPDAAGAAGPQAGHGSGGDVRLTVLQTPRSRGQGTGQWLQGGQGADHFLEGGNRPAYGGGRSTGYICQRSELQGHRVNELHRKICIRQTNLVFKNF